MGLLAKYLQVAFADLCPSGWDCRCEVPVLSKELENRLGYSPRADVCLVHHETSRRLWIEFEISRADPVANHAKFATAHLFKPFSPDDSFVSMVSSHVNRGRRNLASNTVHLLRHIGIPAFQTVLLPTIEPEEIKRLNHASLQMLQSSPLDARLEMSRAFQISEPVIAKDRLRIHFASELFDVIRNLYRWNAQVMETDDAALWKRRTVTYFVFDPISQQFAPSKFCAYVIPILVHAVHPTQDAGLMDMATYCRLDETEPKFDGYLARNHLTQHLGMRLRSQEDEPAIAAAFTQWVERRTDTIHVHPAGPKFLLPPDWYR